MNETNTNILAKAQTYIKKKKMQENGGVVLPFVITPSSANRSLKFVKFSQEKFWVLFGQLIRKHRDCVVLTTAFQQTSSLGPEK